MSRIGNKVIAIPAGVSVEVNGSTVTVKGPKGTLTKTFKPNVNVKVENNEIVVTRINDEKVSKQLTIETEKKAIIPLEFNKQVLKKIYPC